MSNKPVGGLISETQTHPINMITNINNPQSRQDQLLKYYLFTGLYDDQDGRYANDERKMHLGSFVTGHMRVIPIIRLGDRS
jgi:hypothetical protein